MYEKEESESEVRKDVKEEEDRHYVDEWVYKC